MTACSTLQGNPVPGQIKRNSRRRPRDRSAAGASGGESVQETGEIQDVQGRGAGAGIAVGVGIAGGELVEEAGEILDVEAGRDGAAVAVGVAQGWGREGDVELGAV